MLVRYTLSCPANPPLPSSSPYCTYADTPKYIFPDLDSVFGIVLSSPFHSVRLYDANLCTSKLFQGRVRRRRAGTTHAHTRAIPSMESIEKRGASCPARSKPLVMYHFPLAHHSVVAVVAKYDLSLLLAHASQRNVQCTALHSIDTMKST